MGKNLPNRARTCDIAGQFRLPSVSKLAIASRSTRQAHSRSARSLAHFRNSLLRAFYVEKTAIQALFSSSTTNFAPLSRYADEYRSWWRRWKSDQKSQKKTHPIGWVFFVAPRTGLEPVTSWLTVMRSTDWAIEEYDGVHKMNCRFSVFL